MAKGKADNKPKNKVKEDLTFGLKNKNKSTKVQKQIATIQQSQAQKGKTPDMLAKERERALLEKRKAEEAKRRLEVADVNKPVIQQAKVPFGVDPQTILCAFFKAGLCEKGKKCKFSHDLQVERKVEKKSLYADDRTKDLMSTWDDSKLQEVVLSKAGNMQTTTDIVCKYFLEAIEAEKYGWFWECPSGLDCKYRHALPPGFKLNSQKKAEAELAKRKVISLEEFIESERHKLGPNLTPVTAETFAKWKKTRMDKKAAEEQALQKAKEAQKAAGKLVGLSGRDLFTFQGDMMDDMSDEDGNDDDWDLAAYRQKRKEDDEAMYERDRLHAGVNEIRDTPTEAPLNRTVELEESVQAPTEQKEPIEEGVEKLAVND